MFMVNSLKNATNVALYCYLSKSEYESGRDWHLLAV